MDQSSSGMYLQWMVLTDSLCLQVVRNAGHILPADQPAAAFDMIDRFITQRGWD